MPKKGKIKARHFPTGKIRPSEIRDDKRVMFCFRYLDLRHEKFTVTNCESGYFCKVLERFKNYSTMQVGEILSSRSKALRAHSINWQDTTEPTGFDLPSHLEGVEGYQLNVTQNYGRIHGFFIENFFFVVWLDPRHALCPMR